MSGLNLAVAFSPWRHAAFRALWTAAFVSNTGIWMQNVGAAWLMTSLADAAVMVALIQTAIGLPALMLALPAGALADIVDRRRVMLLSQWWMLVTCGLLTLLTGTGWMGPWLLLLITFSWALARFSTPAQQATTADVVPQDELPRAVVLSAISFNSARSIGPLLAGALLALGGSRLVFAANVVSFGLAALLLASWKRQSRPSAHTREPLFAGMLTGLRYARFSGPMRRLLLRSCLLVGCGSALWALLPLVARTHLGLGPLGYGVLLACLGFGSLLAAGVLPWLRDRLPHDRIIATATVAYAAASVAVAMTAQAWLVCAALLVAGMAWVTANSTISAMVQTTVPGWVRARSLAIHLLGFYGSMAFGALAWGALATQAGTVVALGLSGLSTLASLALAPRWPLVMGRPADTASATRRLVLAGPTRRSPAEGDGPVVVRIVYRLDPAHKGKFVALIRQLSDSRARCGARICRVSLRGDDLATELFVLPSWSHWLLYLARRVEADEQLESAACSCVAAGELPRVELRVQGSRHAVRTASVEPCDAH